MSKVEEAFKTYLEDLFDSDLNVYLAVESRIFAWLTLDNGKNMSFIRRLEAFHLQCIATK